MEARVICTCNRQIEEAVERGQFRRDLYYRINVFRVQLRALSERREDIPMLTTYFYEQLSRLYEREVPSPPPRMLQMLQDREWKGNIRELQNRVASYILLGSEETAEDKISMGRHLAAPSRITVRDNLSLKRIAESASREPGRGMILQALKANHWNRRRAAEQLKISYRTLLYKIRDAGIPSKRGRKQLSNEGSAKVRTPEPNSESSEL